MTSTGLGPIGQPNANQIPARGLEVVEAALQKTIGSRWVNNNSRSIHSSLLNQLANLRHGISPFCADNDPVLMVCIQSARSQELSNELWNKALRKLDNNLECYKEVLGQALPESLESDFRARQEYSAYHSGANPTALHDWSYFRRPLSSDEVARATFTTGLAGLDTSLGGGVWGCTFVGGDKGVGKTTLMLQVAISSLHADPQTAVLFMSLDMEKERIYERIFCRESGGYNICDLWNPNMSTEQTAILNNSEQTIKQRILPRLRVVERDYSHTHTDDGALTSEVKGLTDNSLFQYSRDLLSATNTTKLLVIVDLFQKILPPSGVLSTSEDIYRLDMLDRCRRSLRKWLGYDHVAFLVASEVRKLDSNTGRIREISRDDLKGDGRIASDADNILLIWPSSKSNDNGSVEMTIRIDKGRDGVVRRDIPLRFHYAKYRFDELPKKREAERNSSTRMQRNPSRSVDALAQ